ncbi:DUF5325 family protein [Peribacillus alkalitolerans]|uniref:DUF5325 family protein n=1 Tax=Peribacillus alkalitolerans TaxID=1550385 RepID=UPI0013D41EB0|nr:DUF5325 family protein [Peribacillus alkalitolerans]
MNGKGIFLFLAFLAAACMMLAGVAIGERSILGLLLSLLGLIAVMGFGFATKSKYRREGKL